jgi:SAM-dependent methyltransferase
MDAYTAETREWLESRYERTSPDGVYVAHQPIYGFRVGYCEPWLLERYVRTLAIMRALASLRWESCVDVGSAEGYKAALARELFGGRVVASDLAETACRRAREIYGLEARAGDVHDLPFDDAEFDVALCSETLEHVSDLRSATLELDRVARRAIVITVPNESAEQVRATRESGVVHGHVHGFEPGTFAFLERELGYSVACRRLVSPLTKLTSALIEGQPKRVPANGARRSLVRAFNLLAPAGRRLFGERTERLLISADGAACRVLPRSDAFIYVAIKDPSARTAARRRVGPRDVLGFTVPPHRI